MLSTIHRRHILEKFKHSSTVSFDELKKVFIETKEMNPTTLYRILESFKKEHIIHEIPGGDGRIFTLCQCQEDGGYKIIYCTSCKSVEESHFPLSKNALKSETVEYLKYCHNCHA